MNRVSKFSLFVTISLLTFNGSAGEGPPANHVIWYRVGATNTAPLPIDPLQVPPPLPVPVEARVEHLEREVATKLSAKEPVVTKQELAEHERRVIELEQKLMMTQTQLMLLTQPALQVTNKITPKSKFTATCPFCGKKKVSSTLVTSRGTESLGNDKFRITWDVQFHCSSCGGNFSDNTKQSIITRANSEQAK